MKKNSRSHKGVQDPGQLTVQQPDKAGWIRKFCGRGIFRELWKKRFVVLRGDHLYICNKEVKDEQKAQEVLHLADYERSEELRKAKSRSKKNHSHFTLLRCKTPGTTAPPLVFLAVSPEDKESWVNTLNVAIIKAKRNRLLDEVTVHDSDVLTHPTRERAKIPHFRRLPTRGHLLSVAPPSSRDLLTLGLVTEEDDLSQSWENSFRVDLQRGGPCGRVAVVGSCGVRGRRRAGTDVSKLRVTTEEPKVKTGSLPRGSKSSWTREFQLEKKVKGQSRSRCSSLDQVLARPAVVVSGAGVQSLIAQKMLQAQEMLDQMKLQEVQKREGRSTLTKNMDSPRLHHLTRSDSPQCRSRLLPL